MIDLGSYLRCFAQRSNTHISHLPLIGWDQDWSTAAGQGIRIGVLDTGFAADLPDLAGADVVSQNFTGSKPSQTLPTGHGTASVSLLVGQGKSLIRGIVPQALLFAAQVVGKDGYAKPEAVARAITWLIASGVHIIAIPLGDGIGYPEITSAIVEGNQQGVFFLASVGNDFPKPTMFPACLPQVVAVGASDSQGNLLPGCCRLPKLDLVVPTANLFVPDQKGVFQLFSGSSAACVLAAGVAALALSHRSNQDKTALLKSLLHKPSTLNLGEFHV